MTAPTTDHRPDRRATDANYRELHERVALLEKTVNETLLPEMGHNTAMTAEIRTKSAEIYVKNNEMYAAFLAAKNGIKMITKTGNGVVVAAEWVARRAKTFFILTLTAGAIWTFFKTGKLPEWFDSLLKMLH